MRTPSITDYVRALENPYGIFRTLGEVEAERDVYREIAPRAGNSAAVFTYMRGGRRRFLKCYIRPNPRLREIYDYAERVRPPLLTEARLLRDEMYVHTLSGEAGWVDVAEGVWAEGETLGPEAARAAGSGNAVRLAGLAVSFDGLCRQLLEQEWAHGDLKPENIVVRPDGSPVLIDLDAMWIPAFAGQKAAELGTPGYRHPLRDASHFDKRIDDYPMLLISASLHALALEPELYARYNTADNMILSPEAVIAGRSAAFGEMLELFAAEGMAREYRMTEVLASPFPEVVDCGRYFQDAGPYRGEPGETPEAVAVNGRWGFAGAGGEVVIAPFWDEALEFRDGRAAVRLKDRWHFIDRSGQVVLAGISYDEMRSMRKK